MHIYLDHNATTPLRPGVLDAMRPYLEGTHGNPASVHSFGQTARAAVDRARSEIKDLVGGPADDLIFTGSGTEAVFLGVVGSTLSRREGPGHVVVSAIEHTAGLDAARALEQRGWMISWIQPDASGIIRPGMVESALREDTVLVSVMHANNETGVIQPVEAIAALCRERGVLYHVDAVQSAGKVPVLAEEWDLDLVSMAAHKMGGPKGVGALWKRREIPLAPVIPGTQEQGNRGGTHNVPGIVGFGAIADLPGPVIDHSHIESLRGHLEEAMVLRIPQASLTAGESPRLPNTSHYTFDSEVGSDLVLALDLEGIAISSGSACTSGSEEPSHVLVVMGVSEGRARTAVRVSLGPGNTLDEINRFVTTLQSILASRTTGAAR
jgi:cysteine desulfurase